MSHTETTEAVERLVEEFGKKFYRPRLTPLAEEIPILGSVTQAQDIEDWLRTALTTIRKETLEELTVFVRSRYEEEADSLTGGASAKQSAFGEVFDKLQALKK